MTYKLDHAHDKTGWIFPGPRGGHSVDELPPSAHVGEMIHVCVVQSSLALARI